MLWWTFSLNREEKEGRQTYWGTPQLSIWSSSRRGGEGGAGRGGGQSDGWMMNGWMNMWIGGESVSPWQPRTNDPTPRKGWEDGWRKWWWCVERREEKTDETWDKGRQNTGEEDISFGWCKVYKNNENKLWRRLRNWRVVREIRWQEEGGDQRWWQKLGDEKYNFLLFL